MGLSHWGRFKLQLQRLQSMSSLLAWGPGGGQSPSGRGTGRSHTSAPSCSHSPKTLPREPWPGMSAHLGPHGHTSQAALPG